MAKAATAATVVNRRVLPVRPSLLSIQPPQGRRGRFRAALGLRERRVPAGSARGGLLAVWLQLHPRRAGRQGDPVAGGSGGPGGVRPGGARPGARDARAEAADDGRTASYRPDQVLARAARVL